MSSLLEASMPKPFSIDTTFEDFLQQQCTYLAEGTSRKVYSVGDHEYVVKVALDHAKATCNWIEVTAFVHFTSDRSKLAQIFSWSESGKFLIMEKLDMSSIPAYPFEFPTWVTDRKSSNIGKAADGCHKVCDYALIKPPDCAFRSEFA